MNTTKINGVSISNVRGRNVIITNGKVIVDGVDVTPDSKDITIEIAGNVDRLQVDACSKIVVTGDVGSIATQSGDVEVGGSVKGSVQTMSGDVDSGGAIGGSVTTMSGDIRSRK